MNKPLFSRIIEAYSDGMTRHARHLYQDVLTEAGQMQFREYLRELKPSEDAANAMLDELAKPNPTRTRAKHNSV